MRLFKQLFKSDSSTSDHKVIALATRAPLSTEPLPEINGQPVPVYPEKSHAVPAYTPDELLLSQSPMIVRLQQASGLSHQDFHDLIIPTLSNFAAYVHLLPASESHHHCGLGGLLRHGLEVALNAAMFCDARVFAMNHPPSIRYHLEPRWRICAMLGGLLHDMGKPIVDVGALSPSGESWNPHDGSLYEWLSQRGYSHYQIQWRPGARHKQHQAFNAISTYRIVPKETLEWLGRYGGQEPIDQMILALAGRPDTRTPLHKILSDADSKSVDRDLKHSQAHLASRGEGSQRALAARIWRAMHDLIEATDWAINKPSSPVWYTNEGIFLVFPSALQFVADRLRQDESINLPADVTVLQQTLADWGHITPNQLPSGHQLLTWNIRLHAKDRGRDYVFDTQALRWDRDDLIPQSIAKPEQVLCEIIGPDGQIVSTAATPDSAPVDEPQQSPGIDEDNAVVRMAVKLPGSGLEFTFDDPASVNEPRPEEPPLRDRSTEIDPAIERIQEAETDYRDPFPPRTAEGAIAWLTGTAQAPEGDWLLTICQRTRVDSREKVPDGTLIAGKDVAEFDGYVCLSQKAMEDLGVPYDTAVKGFVRRQWHMPRMSRAGNNDMSYHDLDGRTKVWLKLNRDMSILARLLLPTKLAEAPKPLAARTAKEKSKPDPSWGPHIPAAVATKITTRDDRVPADAPFFRAAVVRHLDALMESTDGKDWRTYSPEELASALVTFASKHRLIARFNRKPHLFALLLQTPNPLIVPVSAQKITLDDPTLGALDYRINPTYLREPDDCLYNEAITEAQA